PSLHVGRPRDGRIGAQTGSEYPGDQASDETSDEADPVVLVAALVRAVTDAVCAIAGGVPATVVAVVPAAWGPRRRALLREALDLGGLGQPVVVRAPVAVGWYLLATGADLPAGTIVAVCNVGVGFECSVVRRVDDASGDGFAVLSTVDSPDAGGAALDTALAAALTGHPATGAV